VFAQEQVSESCFQTPSFTHGLRTVLIFAAKKSTESANKTINAALTIMQKE
jgi:hypothetical protein